MLNYYTSLVNKQLKQILKLCYKHDKVKYSSRSFKTLCRQSNLNNLHVLSSDIKLFKQIHIISNLSTRIFKDSENMYAYNILQTIPIERNDLFEVKSPNQVISTLDDFNKLLDQNWRTKSATEIVDGFKSVQSYCIQNNINVSDQRFDKLVDGLADHVEDLTDNELLELLNCLVEYPACDSYTSHNFHDIWSALDDVCCWKMNTWSNETMFIFADCWYRLNLGKFSDFVFNFIDRMQKRLNHLSSNQLVHLSFYLKIHQRHKLSFEYERAVDQFIPEMSLKEISIIAIAFVRAEHKVKLQSTVACIINKLKQDLPNADEICVRRIVEVLRYSSHVLLIDQLLDLLDHLIPEIDRLSNLCCVHMALLGTTLQFLHKASLEKISQKLIKHITDPSQMRLKDIERWLVALTMFDLNPNTDIDVYDAIHKEIHTENRRKEVVKYVKCLPSILNLLSMRKIYSYELMDEILCNDRILEVYGKSPKLLPRDVFSLDVCIDAECPDYRGNRLNKTFRHKAAKWIVEYTPTWDQHKKITNVDKLYLAVQDSTAKVVGGQENVHTDHILPNFVKSDIIVSKNKDGNFVQPSGFENYILGDVMHAPNTSLKWYAIIPLSWNNVIRNTTIPLGLINMKCRLLKAVGYEPIVITWSEFLHLQEKDKIEYIKNRIT